MAIRLISVGHKMPAWVNAAYGDYSKRLVHEWSSQLVEIKPEKRNQSKSTDMVLKAEAERILPHWDKTATNEGDKHRILLDEHGKTINTVDFSQLLSSCFLARKTVVFLIGGADGVASVFRENTEQILSFSKFTLPHSLARIMLIEQIYRAMTLAKGHPYHRY